jgi:NAD(P)-dependent dehydrogenase (short-subunit alcohol dehydrogenase family)
MTVALVTGTSSGIGLHSAVGLARAGCTVVATMRDLGRRRALDDAAAEAGVELDVRTLDVVDGDSVGSCFSSVVSDHGGLDVLVNNAGQGLVGTLEQLSDHDLRSQMDVNFFAVALLTRLALGVMRPAGRGRVLTVTSVGGVVGQPFNDAYCAAKFAVEGLMQSLAPVAARLGIDVSVVEPGPVSTEFVSGIMTRGAGALRGAPHLHGHDDADPYAPLLGAYVARTQDTFANAQRAEEVAAVVVEAAITDRPRFRWQTSEAASTFVGMSIHDLHGDKVIGETATWLM